MKKLFIGLSVLIFAFNVYGQMIFPSDKNSEYTTKTVLAVSVKQDTAETKYLDIPQKVKDVIVYANVDSASTGDSLKIEIYQSADASRWKLTNTMGTITVAGTNRLLLEDVGKYLKFKYYVQGTSSAFKFSIKTVPK
ncbi:MAG: hypothetical protein ACM3MI_10955 [Clostridiales bacterium]